MIYYQEYRVTHIEGDLTRNTGLPKYHDILPGIQGYPYRRRYYQEYRVTHIEGDLTRNTGLPT